MVAKRKERRQMSRMGSLFSFASDSTMPLLGADDAEMQRHLHKSTAGGLLLKPEPIDDTPVNKHYLQKISTGLKFEEDVVKERCFYLMPYDSKYLAEALDVNDLITAHQQVRKPTRKRRTKTDFKHEMHCQAKPLSLKPLKKKIARKAFAMSLTAKSAPTTHTELVSSSPRAPEAAEAKSQEVFLTEIAEGAEKKNQPESDWQTLQDKLRALRNKTAKEDQQPQQPQSVRFKAEKMKSDWDSILISKLSPMTATWIVHERTSPSKHREELQKALEEWYGQPKHTDLLRDEDSGSEEEFDPLQKDKKIKPKKKWTKGESLLSIVYEIPPEKAGALDPYSDDNQAPFYRQPAGMRRKKKLLKKEEEVIAVNRTAQEIVIRQSAIPRPPTLGDFFNPRIGSKIYDTDNLYEQDLLTGVEQLHPCRGDGSIIIMANQQKYKKVLRNDYPEAPERWYPETEDGTAKTSHHIRSEHGARRWKTLPEPYYDRFQGQKLVLPGEKQQASLSGDVSMKKQVKKNISLAQILNEWRAKWNLRGQFANATYDDIIRDMADIQPHVRLKAIATVGKAAECRTKVDSSSEQDFNESEYKVPKQIFLALNYLLDDVNDKVKRAAAITLYVLKEPTEKAQLIMKEMLQSQSSVERWAAVQCLAHFGMCNSQIVDETLKQILETEEPVKQEKGISLLAMISNNTTLVHGMVAEHLNSSSWRHRVIACKILPTLCGTINKDVTHKLMELMWHDWHAEVRCAAAQCLGKTSHGRDVHDDIGRCMLYGSERTKLEAISRLGQLGIMTAKLLPAFLQCFDDQYMSIRCECCITCSNLQIKEEQVIKKLVHLATYDPMWKVKALAIQALGKVGVVNEDVKESLLWAMNYDKKAAVRAEACHSLVELKILGYDVIQILKERLLIETSPVVRIEMVEALQVVGLNATDDMDMVTQIKDEVRKLCSRTSIASQIVLTEADEMRQQNLSNMIYRSQQELQRKYPKRNNFMKMLKIDQYKEYLQFKRKYSKELYEKHPKFTLRIIPNILTSRTTPRTHAINTQLHKPFNNTLHQNSNMPSFNSATSKTQKEISYSTQNKRKSSITVDEKEKQTEPCPKMKPLQLEEEVPQLPQEPLSKGSTPATTPEPTSREATMLTPSADKEVEAIMTREDAASMPSRATSMKSRPTTGETFTSGTYTSLETVSRTSKLSLAELHIEQDFEPPLALTRARPRLGLSPSASIADDFGPQVHFAKTPRWSFKVNQEAISEREKLNKQTNITYTGLSARYTDMTVDLTRIDSGLNVAPPGSSKFLTVSGTKNPVPPKTEKSKQTAKSK